MTIEPCPHCYRKVIPMADGTCPSCGKNTKNLAGADPHKVLIGIRPGDRLPPVCFECGTPTQKTKNLDFEAEPQNATFGGSIGEFAARFLEAFSFIARFERLSKTSRIGIRLPVCRDCRKRLRRINPQHIDFEAHRVDLVVHK